MRSDRINFKRGMIADNPTLLRKKCRKSNFSLWKHLKSSLFLPNQNLKLKIDCSHSPHIPRATPFSSLDLLLTSPSTTYTYRIAKLESRPRKTTQLHQNIHQRRIRAYRYSQKSRHIGHDQLHTKSLS